MRILILLLFVLFNSVVFADTASRIQRNEERLNTINSKQSALSKKLKSIGDNINDKNAKINNLDKEIKSLQRSIDLNQKLYLEQEKIFDDSQKKLNSLTDRLNVLQNELIGVILKDMTIAMILNSKEPLNEDSIANEEILKHLSDSAKEKVAMLIKERERLQVNIKLAQEKINNARMVIVAQKEKKIKLENSKLEQQALANRMKDEIESYNNEIEKLDNERTQIQQILVDLNILQKKELENQESKREKLQKDDKNAPSIGNNIAPIEVRQIGSSYRNVSTARYTGKKTIAPLKDYTIETKYGPYFDPVYKIKVFNEFVTFGVKRRSAVLSVLDGKIVFAKSTAMLKMVVIIEHSNGVHTIYSYLDEIPSNINVGARVKKGSTIAYVSDKLNFEVTQKDKHINPLDFVYIK